MQRLKKNSQCHTLYPRYDSQGQHLGSLPDIITPRADHACATFVSSRGEQVGFQKLTIFYLLIEKGFLITGGAGSNGELSSTELYLPSKKKWTPGGNLPR